jgi:DegV family protein with EDD domain
MSAISIVTDTVSYMPEEISNRYHITQVPVHIIIEGKTHLENQLDLTSFYQKILKWKEQNRLPTTSSPSPDDFMKIYRELSKDYEYIFYIGYSRHLGMTVQAASLAKNMVEDELSDTKIEVIDSMSWGGAQMFVAIEAARAASQGATPNEVLKVSNELVSRVNQVILSDNLYYLAKGGRIHKARPWADSKISNTVLLRLDASSKGQTTPIARCRTKGEALKTLFNLVQSSSINSKLHVAINHADALLESEQLKERALSQFQCEEVLISNIGPLVAIHTGLGTRAFNWWHE